jgi:hypothetical protein
MMTVEIYLMRKGVVCKKEAMFMIAWVQPVQKIAHK